MQEWGKGDAGDGEVSRIKRDKKEKQGRGENRTAVEGLQERGGKESLEIWERGGGIRRRRRRGKQEIEGEAGEGV